MYPYLSLASLAIFSSSDIGAVTSKATVSAPASLRSAIRAVLRALAMTLWPRARASRAIYFPKPELAAVMNHIGVLFDIVGVRKVKCMCVAGLVSVVNQRKKSFSTIGVEIGLWLEG